MAKELNKKPSLENFWKLNKQMKIKQNKKPLHHGKDWHKETMKTIETYFLSAGYKVIREPNLSWGRADLGIYKKGHRDLYIEVGTTSLSKLWINLATMPNIIYLLHPNDNIILEFNTNPKLHRYTNNSIR